jgi:hypothetical protein
MNSKDGFLEIRLIGVALWAIALVIVMPALSSHSTMSESGFIAMWIVLVVAALIVPEEIVAGSGFLAFWVALIFLAIVAIRGCAQKDTAVDINEPQPMTNANPQVDGIGTNRAEPSP